MGENIHPRWPDFDAYAILAAYLPWAAGLVASLPLLLPAFVYSVARGANGGSIWVLLALFTVLPAGFVMMAALSAILHGSVTAAHPLVVLKAILRIGGSYLKVWILGSSWAAVGLVTFLLLSHCENVAVILVGSGLAWIVFLYGAMVAARALGVAYYRAAAKIGWFPERQRWGVRG